MIFNSKEIAINYLKSWFVADLLSSVPWVLVYTVATEDSPESVAITLRVLKYVCGILTCVFP